MTLQPHSNHPTGSLTLNSEPTSEFYNVSCSLAYISSKTAVIALTVFLVIHLLKPTLYAVKEKLIDYSPITYLKTMTKPMLVIQGANDPRVVKAESDQIVQALKDKGRDVEYMLLEDEGHGFSKKENEIAVYQKTLAFFNQFVTSKIEV